ncbi:helix-turn-helix domain-containing protein [Alkaliphilus sp. B6464]|uniref:helix-turn-helix domain-containing protein n=1 Tax=Alkaliphilus sp. B6464 TaxID=2731219 RepID=UPI001BABB9AA|nr:helix-turn-helix domain-containing protein [Alkaliphilus sp. B6464]QUH20262.1 helix-turn-helix domain-containing protein [Alkaliphilus sp. B6464]
MEDRLIMQKLAYKLKEVAEMLSVSYSTIFRMVERGEIATVKVSTVRRIPLWEVERLVG